MFVSLLFIGDWLKADGVIDLDCCPEKDAGNAMATRTAMHIAATIVPLWLSVSIRTGRRQAVQVLGEGNADFVAHETDWR